MKKWGIYSPNRKLAVRLIWQPDRPAVDRPGRPPTVKNMTVGAPRSTAQIQRADSLFRSTGRSTAQIQRAKLSGPVDRPVDRPYVCQTCTRLCTSVDRNGRPAHGAVDRAVDRPGLSATSWVRTWVKFIYKNSFNSSKIP